MVIYVRASVKSRSIAICAARKIHLGRPNNSESAQSGIRINSHWTGHFAPFLSRASRRRLRRLRYTTKKGATNPTIECTQAVGTLKTLSPPYKTIRAVADINATTANFTPETTPTRERDRRPGKRCDLCNAGPQLVINAL